MQLILDELSRAITSGAHGLVIMDRAGWHCASELAVPANVTPVFLPAYSPELNAIERLWLFLRERFLERGCRAWNSVRGEAGRIRSLCDYDWARVTS